MNTSNRQAPREGVAVWYWRYKDPVTGEICVSDKTLTPEEAAGLTEAEAIEGSKTFRGSDDEDTTPDVFRTQQGPLG